MNTAGGGGAGNTAGGDSELCWRRVGATPPRSQERGKACSF